MFKHLSPQKFPDLVVKQKSTGRFYVTPDGNEYPSITTVLGYKEKPYLTDWRNMLGKDKAQKETERCAERGTAVHELIEHYLNNKQDFTRGYKPEYVRGFNQLKLCLNRINNIRSQEIALWSDQLKLAGRVDCIGEYNGKLAIIDFKTSNNNKTPDNIEDYFIQCTAYAIMWFELTNEPIEDIVILMYVEKGMLPLVFQEKIDKYIQPLLNRITEYNQGQK